MRRVMALVRARALTAASYRVQLLLSLVSLLATAVPLYFIARALQPTMASAIQAEGGEYFGFLLVGMVALTFLSTATNVLPGEFGGDLRTGTLEAVLSTSARMPEVLAGMLGFGMIWTTVRAGVLLATGWALGAEIAWAHLPIALAILALLVLAYLPFGIIASALVIAFRTTGPLTQGVLFLSAMLGGVYYPTRIIPDWLQDISGAIPLTYGLRALRRVLLEGAALPDVVADIGILSAFVLVLCCTATLVLSAAIRYARRTGTLTQY